MSWRETIFGKSSLTLMREQAKEDRESMLAYLRDSQSAQAESYSRTIDLMKELTTAVTASAGAFNRYLDIALPKTTPEVRVMDDTSEVIYEHRRKQMQQEAMKTLGISENEFSLTNTMSDMFSDVAKDFL